jgi:hypothetical protein
MKKNDIIPFVMAFCLLSFGQTKVFMNEIHYDNAKTDRGEGVEIAGPSGSDLSSYKLTLYNGGNNSTYGSVIKLSGVIPNQSNGFGALFFPIRGLQNGSPDGMALDNNGTLIQFLSYEGTITAANGVAVGNTSTDIGVAENGTTTVGHSLQLNGTGNSYEDFSWRSPAASTYNALNNNQTFSATAAVNDLVITEIQLYPNPTSDGIVHLKTKSQDPIFVQLYNALGENVFSKTINHGAPLNVQDLLGGVYMVRLTQHHKVCTKKLVIR